MASAIDQRVERDDEFTIRIVVSDESGKLADADGDVSVTVTDSDGSTTHTDTITTSDSTGVYTTTHPAHSTLERLTADVSYTLGGESETDVIVVEVVAFRLPPLNLLRTRIDDERDEANLTTLAARDLERVAQRVEDSFRSILGYHPAEAQESLARRLRGERSLRLPEAPFLRSVQTLTAYAWNGNAVSGFDETDVRVRDHKLQGAKGAHLPDHYVEADITTGRWTGTAPTDLERAGVEYGLHLARQSELPARAQEVVDQGTLIRLSTPTAQRPTGIPEVDGVLRRYVLPTV